MKQFITGSPAATNQQAAQTATSARLAAGRSTPGQLGTSILGLVSDSHELFAYRSVAPFQCQQASCPLLNIFFACTSLADPLLYGGADASNSRIDSLQHLPAERKFALVQSLFKVIRGPGGTVIPNIEEQKVIALAISLYRDNSNFSAVCRTLDRMGCLSRSGKPFRPEQIKRIIPDYAGQTRRLRTTKAASIRPCLLEVA